MSRFRKELDLVEHFRLLEQRISKLETSNRSNNTSVDSGSFAINGGRLVVNDSMGNIIYELLREDENPVVYIHPTFGNPNQDKIKISGTSDVGRGPEYRVEILQSDDTPLGGYLSVREDGVALIHTNNDVQSGIEFSAEAASQGIVTIKGKFWPNQSLDPNQATFVGQINVDTGFSALTVSYDREMTDGVMVPVPALMNSAGAVAWSITSQTTTDFTVAWAGTDAKTINYWCYVIPMGAA